MPLSPPSSPRTLQHTRTVVYRGYLREDGLWDIEGELQDVKPMPTRNLRTGGMRPAGTPIHHMWLRVTVNSKLVVQAIETSMDSVPVAECPHAAAALQKMVGCSMGRGWRQAIQHNLGGVASCTHLRELLFNLATATFQSFGESFATTHPDEPPRYLDQCVGWDRRGSTVRDHFPRFYIQPESTMPETGQEHTGEAAAATAQP
jgi:Protein of unknown function (DUF2889).